MNKRQIKIISILSIIIVIFMVIIFNNKPKKHDKMKMNKKEKITYLKSKKIKNKTIEINIKSFGQVLSGKKVYINSEVQGKIEKGNVILKNGANFKKNEILFRVENKQVYYSLKAIKSDFLNTINAIMPDLKLDYPKNYSAWKNFVKHININKPIIQLPEIKDLREQVFLASKNILSNYYNIKSEEEKIKKYIIKAPFDGSFSEVKIEVGSVVSPGTTVATIIKDKNIEVIIPINTKDINYIKKGRNIIFRSENNEAIWDGKIKRISKIVNKATQSINVFAEIKNNQNLYEGMYLKSIFKIDSIILADEIPRRAIINNSYVYIIQKDSSIIKKKIKIERISGNMIITKSLINNDIVVIEPISTKNKNAKILPLLKLKKLQ